MQVKRYREAELTHGRVCMLAAIGFLVGEAVQDKTLFYNWDGNITGSLPLLRSLPGCLLLCRGACFLLACRGQM